MKFDSLKQKCLYYRGLTDNRLMPNSYVLVMLDGRAFSSKIKKKFKLPFDDDFINMMSNTALYLCNNIPGCKFAYSQSDEITLVLTDFDDINTGTFFDYRVEKLCSIIASMATSKFNQFMTVYELNKNKDNITDTSDYISKLPLHEFDCKCWNVPTYNDVFAYILYRQNDCIRNSKQQFAQCYLPHKELEGLNVDEQIAKVMDQFGYNWDVLDFNKKFGRFIFKDTVYMKSEEHGEFTREKFNVYSAFILNEETGRQMFEKTSKIPQIS